MLRQASSRGSWGPRKRSTSESETVAAKASGAPSRHSRKTRRSVSRRGIMGARALSSRSFVCLRLGDKSRQESRKHEGSAPSAELGGGASHRHVLHKPAGDPTNSKTGREDRRGVSPLPSWRSSRPVLEFV